MDPTYPVTLKIRTEQGCFCAGHSPETKRFIDDYLRSHDSLKEFQYREHETGPEIIAWLALGTAGLALTKSLVDFVTSIINACQRGKKKGDNLHGKLILIVRDTHRTDESTEEVVMELYENDLVTSVQVQKAIEKGLSNRSVRK